MDNSEYQAMVNQVHKNLEEINRMYCDFERKHSIAMEKEIEESDYEWISAEIDNFCRLQRIKKAMPEGTVNDTLDFEIKVSGIKLANMGVDHETLILQE